ncbi:MAG: hypothetical protein Q8936_13220 [Bacillota bacterium]|nr:hypothetical protein [Bacillota bacterium]
MLYIITGDINSGKTTKLLDIYNRLKRGDGFFNRKKYIDGHYMEQGFIIYLNAVWNQRRNYMW